MEGVSSRILEFVREEDFVEYYLFPPTDSADEKCQLDILNSILSKANKIVEGYTKNFLWHKEEFKLIPRISNGLSHIDNHKGKWQFTELSKLINKVTADVD